MTLGRLSKEKGYDVLLRAFRTVYQKHNDVVLAIIGDGDEGKRLMVLAKELGIAERVRFLGFKKSPLDYLKAADIFVCSSLYEGFSLATLEAMLCKLPVVATRVGSIPDMIKHSISGLLVEPGDPKQLTGALLDLIYNKYDKKLMGEKALETVIKRYDIRNTVKAYYELYKCIVTE